MKIFPAIDILDGGCVRLFQGDFEQRITYQRDPLEIALAYQSEGAKYLHLVDLDGAKAGELKNISILEKLASQTSLSVDYGGGINSKEDIHRLLDAGAKQVSVGSSAVKEPELFIEWLSEFGEKIILSADVNNGQVQISGWQLATPFSVSDLILRFKPYGLKYVSCTDVSKDGTMSGPNFLLYRDLVHQFPGVSVIASGGVASLEDIAHLKNTEVYGVIIGKALLDGRFKLKDALALA